MNNVKKKLIQNKKSLDTTSQERQYRDYLVIIFVIR